MIEDEKVKLFVEWLEKVGDGLYEGDAKEMEIADRVFDAALDLTLMVKYRNDRRRTIREFVQEAQNWIGDSAVCQWLSTRRGV